MPDFGPLPKPAQGLDAIKQWVQNNTDTFHRHLALSSVETADTLAVTGVTTLNSLQGLAWTTWTPSYSGITIGTGTVTARYVQIGDVVHFIYQRVWGTTT